MINPDLTPVNFDAALQSVIQERVNKYITDNKLDPVNQVHIMNAMLIGASIVLELEAEIDTAFNDDFQKLIDDVQKVIG